MKTPLMVLPLAALVLLAGCGSSKQPPGHALAVKACQSTGQAAATYASQAAAVNSTYSKLSVDESAAAAQEAQTGAETGLGSSAAGTLLTGQGAGFTVLEECVSLGLPAVPKH